MAAANLSVKMLSKVLLLKSNKLQNHTEHSYQQGFTVGTFVSVFFVNAYSQLCMSVILLTCRCICILTNCVDSTVYYCFKNTFKDRSLQKMRKVLLVYEELSLYQHAMRYCNLLNILFYDRKCHLGDSPLSCTYCLLQSFS